MKIGGRDRLPEAVVLPLLTFDSPCTSSTKNVNITPGAEDNFRSASFVLRIPEKVKRPSYILVLLPEFNHNGAMLLEQIPWLAFAEETDAAMVACTFKAMDRNKENYVHYAAAQHGSGASLESAIELLDAKNSSHSFKDLPLLIYGISAGGQLAYGFSCYNPKRMIGFAAIKGGYYFPNPVDGTYSVPGLVVSGEKDLVGRRKAIRTLFESHRKIGAPWCWMEDAGGHEEAECLSVVIPYFKELIRLRLKNPGMALQDIPKRAGVTVNLVNKRVLHAGITIGNEDNHLKTGFLPSETVFQAWTLLDIGKRKYAEPVTGEFFSPPHAPSDEPVA
ncbi:hypothetical protein ACFLZM_01895 [Thermodesulfobacteriota bacterium]